jgi:hypothetical protein
MTTDPDALDPEAALSAPPPIVQITADAWDLELVAESLAEEFAAEVRAVRGAEMKTRALAIAECAAALAFSVGSRPGWEGFAAGLAEPELPPGNCVLLVVDAPDVLADEPDGRHWRSFVRSLVAAVERARASDEADRARLILVVMHAPAGAGDALADRLAAALGE